MLLLASGILLFSGLSFAQDANLLAGLAGASSTISYYGPYYAEGAEYWIARIEPENASYVISRSALVRDPEAAGRVLATHGTYALALERSGIGAYFAAPAMLALGAGDVFFGLAGGLLVPFAFGTERMLVGSVAGVFLPPPASELALDVLSWGEAALGTELGLKRDELRIYEAGWDARLALEDVKAERSYESAVAYSRKALLVVNRTQAFAERTGGSHEATDRLADAAMALQDGGFGAALFGDPAAAKGRFREAGMRSVEKMRSYARDFCELPWCDRAAWGVA